MQKFFVVALFLTAFAAQADVRLFREGRRPETIPGTTLSSKASNRGERVTEIYRYLESQKGRLGIAKADGETLPLRSAHRDERGTSYRFVQRHHRVAIEDADLVVLVDASGSIELLNSSLRATPRASANPSISRDAALKAAVQSLGYADAELGDGAGDGLLYMTRGLREPALVWQFSLREHGTAEKAIRARVLAQGPRAGMIAETVSLAHELGGKISIYDASVTIVVPNPIYKGVKVLEDGKPTLLGRALVKDEARNANTTLERVRDYFVDQHGRDGWDGKGAAINAAVNVQRIGGLDLLKQKQNAAWMGPWKLFIFGAGGDELGGFATALDVVGHEFTHAVVHTTSQLAPGGQSGALNEHLADVFGALVERHFGAPGDPFLIGDTVLRGRMREKARALRDMLHPEKGLSPQPTSMAEVPAELGPGCAPDLGNDACGVHILNGIPNRATALIVQKLGWETVEPLYYRVMTARLRSSSKFDDYREQVVDEIGAKLGAQARATAEEAFRTVGL